MPRPLAAWMNGQRNCNGGAVFSASENTLVPRALMPRRLAAGIARRMFLLNIRRYKYAHAHPSLRANETEWSDEAVQRELVIMVTQP
jgi:hypothetical protein